jgi:hypothetical protein
MTYATTLPPHLLTPSHCSKNGRKGGLSRSEAKKKSQLLRVLKRKPGNKDTWPIWQQLLDQEQNVKILSKTHAALFEVIDHANPGDLELLMRNHRANYELVFGKKIHTENVNVIVDMNTIILAAYEQRRLSQTPPTPPPYTGEDP